MARFPTPVPTLASGERGEINPKVGGKPPETPPAPPPPPPCHHSQSCQREQTPPKRFNPALPFTALSKKPFQGLYFVHSAKTYDWMISRLIAEISRG